MLKYLAALALVPTIASAAAPDPYYGGAPTPVRHMMLAYSMANDDCRGTEVIGSFNPQCVRRNQLFARIMSRGWCWNVSHDPEAVAVWAPCKVHGHT